MKEATGETSMTMITIAAIAVIGALLSLLWPNIRDWITREFGEVIDAGNDLNNDDTVIPGINGANP